MAFSLSHCECTSLQYLWLFSASLEVGNCSRYFCKAPTLVSLFLPLRPTSLTSSNYALRPERQFARNTLINHTRIHALGQGVQSVNGSRSRSDPLPQAIRRYSGLPSHPIPSQPGASAASTRQPPRHEHIAYRAQNGSREPEAFCMPAPKEES